jgi:hypothetical protein
LPDCVALIVASVSPYKVKVKVGKHTVLVQATDLAGNVESEPASYKFKRTKR